MAPRNRYCPLCNTHIWYSQKSLDWYAKDGTNCVGDTLTHHAPALTKSLQLT